MAAKNDGLKRMSNQQQFDEDDKDHSNGCENRIRNRYTEREKNIDLKTGNDTIILFRVTGK